MMLVNTVAIVRYIMIFVLKNPVALNDDFWNLFLNASVMIFASVTQAVYFMSPGKM